MEAPAAVERSLLGFTRALAAAGLAVTPDRAQGFLTASAALGAGDPSAVARAGRATLCGSPEDLARHDQVFAAWFGEEPPPPTRPVAATPVRSPALMPDTDVDPGDDAELDDDPLRAAASATEVLRHRDVAELDARERAALAALFETVRPRAPRRRAARRTAARRGEVDARVTVRRMLAAHGEPARLAHRRRGERHRRVVLLLDVSGSMSAYADALLRLAHRYVTALPPGGVEVFSVGTRLTHLTRALRDPDPDRALVAAGRVVPDWSGGTRLGEALGVFLARWGRRGLARGAVVVVCSDGWERGDAAELGEQMRRLRLLAHRVLWVNPHRGKDGYAPIQAGIVAALPSVDELLAGHSLATFTDLAHRVGRA